MVNSTRGFILSLACLVVSFCFSVLLALRSTHLEKRELVCMLFVRLFVLRLLVCVSFIFHLVSRIGCDLCLLHFLDFYFYLYARHTCNHVGNSVPRLQYVKVLCAISVNLLSTRIAECSYRHIHKWHSPGLFFLPY